MAKPYLSNQEEIQRLQQQLIDWTNRKDELTKKITSLKLRLKSLGLDVNRPIDLKPRNRKIYKLCLAGKHAREIGDEFGLSGERVRQIYHSYEQDEIFRLYQKGHSLAQLKSKFPGYKKDIGDFCEGRARAMEWLSERAH